MAFLKRLLLHALSGLLFAAAFPPFHQWWLAWFWLLPLLFILWAENPRRGGKLAWFGFRQGWLTGLFAFTATLWWAGHVTVPGMIALCCYLALFPALWGAFAAAVRPHSPAHGFAAAAGLALLWTGLEWVRSWLLTGFPWNGAATPLIEMPGLRALAAWTGVTGLAAVPLFFMTGIAAAWTLRRHRNTRTLALLLCTTLALPAILTLLLWQKTSPAEGRVPVLLVQPNVPMDIKMNLDLAAYPPEEQQALADQRELQRYQDLATLTVEGIAKAKEKPVLTVWPESALPRFFHDTSHKELFSKMFTAGTQALITGCDALTAAESGSDAWQAHNCVALIHQSPENFVLHAKVHLVPFGEYIPLRKALPFLEKMLGDLIPTDFAAGKSLEPLHFDGMPCQVIPLVCFEDTIAHLARKFVRDAPQIIVNVTNDNWFHESNESAIHALNARWRCIELDRPMIRAANTGVTCVIDTEGRITSELPRWKAGSLFASVPYHKGGITFYAAHGEVIAASAGAAGLLLLIALLFQRRSQP